MNRAERDAARYQRDKEKIKARCAEYYHRNRAARIAHMIAYQEKNKEKLSSYRRGYYLANRDRYAERREEWRRRNRGATRALVRAQQARKLRATPKWANLEAIKKIYDEAAMRTRSTGVQWVVDHIYPLKSPLVCGLHTEANLQILTREENSRKHNKMPEAI